MLVCNWLHSVGQNHFYVMMHLYRDLAIQKSSRRFCTASKLEKSDPLKPSGRRDIPSGQNCPKHYPSGRRELSVQSFLCVEKLRIALACIRPDVSAARPDDTQCSISYGISFQNTDMGRQLQSSGRCGFPSRRAHP
jgi:hypothetical protein